MKNLILIIVLFIGSSFYSIQAQDISLKAGVLFYNLYLNDTLKYNNIEYTFNTGYSVDLLADLRIANSWSLSTKLGIKTKSGQADGIILGQTSTGEIVTASKEFSFVNLLGGIHLLYAIKLSPIITFKPYAGINLEYNVSEKFNTTRTSEFFNPDNLYDSSDLHVQYNNSGLSTTLGFRIQLDNLFIESEYEWELYRMYIYEVGSSKSGVFKLLIGYNFYSF